MKYNHTWTQTLHSISGKQLFLLKGLQILINRFAVAGRGLQKREGKTGLQEEKIISSVT